MKKPASKPNTSDSHNQFHQNNIIYSRDEEKFRELIEISPIPMLRKDYSALKESMTVFKAAKKKSFKSFVFKKGEVVSLIGKVKIMGINRAALELFGVKNIEEYCKTYYNVINDETLKLYISDFTDFLEEKTDASKEIKIITKSGEDKYIIYKWTASYDADKIISGLFVTMFDITDVRKMEAELREKDNQIRQIQKMEAVGRLAGGIAHDFNNTMTAIIGYSSLALAKMDKLNPIYKDIEEIKKAGDRAANLTHQLLAFSRKQVLNQKVFSINGMLLDMEKMLKRLIGEDVQLAARLDARNSFTKADPSQIEQVIMNLIINARDAVSSKGRITVSTEEVFVPNDEPRKHFEIRSGHYIKISIADNGKGIKDDELEHVFEPFFTTKDYGTGLGLAVVYGIVKQHGGFIDIRSKLGYGTAVEVFLAQWKEKPKEEAERIVTAAEKYSGKNETILLIEDEDAVRMVASRILSSNGYNVLEAAKGSEAVEIYKKEKKNIALVFTDIILPDTDGVELALKFKKITPKLKVVFSSGYASHKYQYLLSSMTNYEFLQKPYDIENMLMTIRRIIER